MNTLLAVGMNNKIALIIRLAFATKYYIYLLYFIKRANRHR